jgi:membrane protein YqaA with SNARE-associated domain
MTMFAPSPLKDPISSIHHSPVPHWILQLGPLGLFLVAVVDSSIVPLPIPGSTDLLLLLLVSHRANPWLCAIAAVAGSLIGGYTAWQLGKKGGEAALHRWVSPRLRARVVDWVQHHPVLAVFLPAVLPPPIPLSPFILASGALGISRSRFLIVFAAARGLRYGLIAWLAVAYGRHVVRFWNALLQKWSVPLLWAFSVVLVSAVAYAIWKLRHPAKSAADKAPAIKTKSA